MNKNSAMDAELRIKNIIERAGCVYMNTEKDGYTRVASYKGKTFKVLLPAASLAYMSDGAIIDAVKNTAKDVI